MSLQCIVAALVAPASHPPADPAPPAQNPPAPTPRRQLAATGGRFAVACFLGLLLPGLGHAVVGRRRAAAVFLTPLLLLTAAALGTYAGGGVTALVAFAVTPGVLPILAILNIGLAVWRIAAAVDVTRRTPNRTAAVAVLAPATLALVLIPQLWVNTTIRAADDFLNSAFAADNAPQETETPDETQLRVELNFLRAR